MPVYNSENFIRIYYENLNLGYMSFEFLNCDD